MVFPYKETSLNQPQITFFVLPLTLLICFCAFKELSFQLIEWGQLLPLPLINSLHCLIFPTESPSMYSPFSDSFPFHVVIGSFSLFFVSLRYTQETLFFLITQSQRPFILPHLQNKSFPYLQSISGELNFVTSTSLYHSSYLVIYYHTTTTTTSYNLWKPLNPPNLKFPFIPIPMNVFLWRKLISIDLPFSWFFFHITSYHLTPGNLSFI